MIKLTEDELNDVNLMIVRIETALQCMNSTAISGIEKDTSKEMLEGYFYGVTNFLAEAKIAEHKWRIEMMKKYNLPYGFVHDNKGNIPTNKEEMDELSRIL